MKNLMVAADDEALDKMEEPIRRCPHDNHKCTHDCEDGECWRELDGS